MVSHQPWSPHRNGSVELAKTTPATHLDQAMRFAWASSAGVETHWHVDHDHNFFTQVLTPDLPPSYLT